MSIQSEIDRLNSAKIGLAAAIETKGVTVPQDATISDYPALVEQIQQGSEPEPPSDGKTRLYISVPESVGSGSPPIVIDTELHLIQSEPNGVSIDWGDGTGPETVDTTGAIAPLHRYMYPGDYVISLTVNDGCRLDLGDGTDGIFGDPDFYITSVQRNLLKKVYVGSGVDTIQSRAFENCYSLTSVYISSGLRMIQSAAFQECYGLQKVVIPDSVTDIWNGAFTRCYSLTNIVIPSGVTNFENMVFSECYSLQTAVINAGPTTIGRDAFLYCSALRSVSLPEGLTVIGERTFSKCESLLSIVIPSSVTTIESQAFYDLEAIREIHLLSQNPPSIQMDTFYQTGPDAPIDGYIYVPAGSLQQYKTATNWSAIADYIKEEPS